MVPESLRLRNFLSHRETDLDLRGVHLASLVGENGAGKSALLDAITWAVWGRSRAPYGRDDDLVYHGESSLEVEFVFRMPYQSGAEQRCRILRRREARGRRSVSSLLDFEVERDGAWRILTSDSIRETQQSIIDHLGLDYDTFINSAYLRQGHADEFTIQSPGQRKSVLSAVLALDQWSVYQERAKVRLSASQGEMREIDRRLAEIEADLARRPEFEAALAEAEVAAETAEAELAEVQQAMDELTRMREQVLAYQRQREDLSRRCREAQAARDELHRELEMHRTRLAQDQARLAQADAIEARYAVYRDAVAEERELVRKLGHAARLQEQRSSCEARIAAAREELTEQARALEQEEARLDRAIADAGAELKRALGELRSQEALLTERFTDDGFAGALRDAEIELAETAAAAQDLECARSALQELKVEQSRRSERNRQLRDLMNETKARLDTLAGAEADCPLCGQPLSPEHHARLLEEIEAQGKVMGDEFRTNRQRLGELDEEQAVLGKTIQVLEARVQVRARQEQALARLQQRREQDEAARERAQALAKEIAALDRRLAEEEFAGAERQAVGAMVEQRVALQARMARGDFATEARAELADIVAQLAEIGYDPAAHVQVQDRLAALTTAEADYRELEKARLGLENTSQALARLEAQVEVQDGRITALTVDEERTEAKIADLQHKLAMAVDVGERLSAVRQEVAAARQRVGAARQNLAALATLELRVTTMREQRATAAERVAIYTELRDAFSVNGIPAMIIEHTLPELERDANRILQQLSGGRMHVRFETQRETKTGTLRETLDIIISDEKGTRPYEGFSGGEQFRINFAIRVALSRMLAQRAGVRLRSLFVDEGFGSLDAEGRQRLVEAVKAVQDEFDMILIITHIDELREAFPTQIQVTKTAGGSQVELL